MELKEQAVDSVEVTNDFSAGFSARGGSCLDEVSIDDESELERVHEQMASELWATGRPGAEDPVLSRH